LHEWERRRTVDLHLAVSDNRLDDATLLEVGQGLASQGTVDLHAVDEGGDSDKAVGLDIFVEPLADGLVEDDGVLGLVLDLALRPLLLLLLSSSCGRLQSSRLAFDAQAAQPCATIGNIEVRTILTDVYGCRRGVW
jgi:hypothetical protein